MTTMVVGLSLWLVYVVARAFSKAVRAWPPPVDLLVAVATGGLIVFSGYA